MYRGSSPIFDVPEFPSMRRVKPLPKRRRAIAHSDQNGPLPAARPPGGASDGPGADGLIAHADALSAQLALQSYYMPILDTTEGLFPGDDNDSTGRHRAVIDLGYHLGGVRGQDDEHSGDGDYIDHLQQPGNTKKRKVPANAGVSPHGHGHDGGVGQAGGDDDPGGSLERGTALGADRDFADTLSLSAASGMALANGAMGLQRRGKLSPATMAGLQHKEMLRQRKRQLAAVLGAISHGDTLALDQALTSTYPFPSVSAGLSTPDMQQLPRVRLSRRKGPRIARTTKALVRPTTPLPFPTAFTFVCHSATSERLVAIKEEVGLLRTRFEAELARQATKAAEAAAAARQAALAASVANRAKSTRAQQRARMLGRGDERAEFLDQNLLSSGAKSRSKKKKRSALAIAANPHHRRNYVPSRLPQSGQANPAQAALNAQNYLGPPPFRFLSAEIPPSRKSRKSGKGSVTPTAQLTNPADEWICPFCEYKLFYGSDAEYRRAVRGRKKILRRRRRAERRAANVTAKMPAAAQEQEKDDYDEFDAGFVAGAAAAEYVGLGKGRGEGAKGERGGDHLHSAYG